MNINIYLEEDLAKELKDYSLETGQSRNGIIREAVREWISHHQAKTWPKSVLQFKGCPEMPTFESTREELLPPSEDPLA